MVITEANHAFKVQLLNPKSLNTHQIRPFPIRDAPHCATVERYNGKIEVIVAGGSLPGSELSTEIFSVTDNRWRGGPNLPKAVNFAQSLPYR